MDHETLIDFPCPYDIETRYNMICSGEYGVFELYDHRGSIGGYRGYRIGYGTTGVYDSYKAAIEAALTEYGNADANNNLPQL
jgi:hypothetical protein